MKSMKTMKGFGLRPNRMCRRGHLYYTLQAIIPRCDFFFMLFMAFMV